MHRTFINLKRFEVPRKLGGLCPADNPVKWIESIIDQAVAFGLSSPDKVQLTYMLPEGLVAAGAKKNQPVCQVENQASGHRLPGCSLGRCPPRKELWGLHHQPPGGLCQEPGATWGDH